MMMPEKFNIIYFLGIGGIGMSALARYFHQKGIKVSGYDRNVSDLTRQLQNEGIVVHSDDSISKIPQKLDLVIYTPAIPDNLSEFVYLKNSGIPFKKRSEVLGWLSKKHKTIAIAGTHGKTTVSTCAAYLLHNSKVKCNAILGGIAKNTGSNLIVSEKSEWLVTEADEFDRSFLQIRPEIATVTSMDADHLDIYGNFQNLKEGFEGFIANTNPEGSIIIKKGVQLKPQFAGNLFSYSLNEKADFFASDIKIEEGQYFFSLVTPFGILERCSLGLPGILNVENAVAAVASALLAGVTVDEIRQNLPGFIGIRRRFDYQINTKNLVFIDDYAHHPEEIRALINSVRDIYPGKKILGIFQPHLYSRTRDFATGFAASLSLLDELILLPVYPAREKPIAGVDSEMVFKKVKIKNKKLVEKNNLLPELENHQPEVILTIGAGDIELLVEPLRNQLLTKNLKT